MMRTVTFHSYINEMLTIQDTSEILTGHFIQWGNSFIVDRGTKIPLTIALVRTADGSLFLANPLGLKFPNWIASKTTADVNW